MLPDKWFLWPYDTDSLRPCIADIEPILKNSGMAYWTRCIHGNLAEYIALVCRQWNVSPFWLLVSAQREQSVLGTPGMEEAALKGDYDEAAPNRDSRKLEAKELAAWLGAVGQDIGRTKLPGWTGVYMQVERLADITAWAMGVEPSEKWPEYLRTRKTVPRYNPGLKVDVTTTGNPRDPKIQHPVCSRGEYVQLCYTPHLVVLEKNEGLARRWTPAKYLL